MKFKLWEEDTSQACNSGRRFKCVFSATSPTRQPWVSLCFKQIDLDSWVALISRDGFLMIMEPSMPQTFIDWHVLEQFQVGPKPPPGEETSFKVAFHQDKHDITHAILGDSQLKSLSLAVAAMDTVMIFRSRDPSSGNSGPLYLAAELKGHGGLVRSVSWANGSARGYDLIATGCKDGKIRIFELRTVLAPSDQTSASAGASASTAAAPRPVGARSGIGEVFGGNTTPQNTDHDNGSDSRVKHTVTEVACIESHDDVWQVGFEPYGMSHYITLDIPTVSNEPKGDTLASSGDDGAVRLWKKAIDGEWIEYGEIEAEEEE
jgi:nucleoporin SEH1